MGLILYFLNYYRPVDYSKNPKVRGAGKTNFDANKNGNGVALLIHLQGRSIEPQTFRMSNSFFYSII